MAGPSTYALPSDPTARRCRGTRTVHGCYEYIRAGQMVAHRATMGHQTRWTRATYHAHIVDTFGAGHVPDAYLAKLEDMPR